MADLQYDILGQVARLPLKPSEANALLPLYEAISNSLHAIQERFGDDHIVAKGRIDIDIIRADNNENSSAVIGFCITDNGVGLNEKNYRSFRTPFSQHKIKKGGKGIGRLGWLKVFEDIEIQSQYLSDQKLKSRDFDFILRDNDQIANKNGRDIESQQPGTRVTLKKFQHLFENRCPAKPTTIAQRIIGHFLPIFAADHAPKIVLNDIEVINIKTLFSDMEVVSEQEIIDINIDGEVQPIIVRHIRCDKKIRPRDGGNNWICFCANDRGVREYAIDDQIGLGLLNGEHIYIGTVTGDYLDKNVNPQRTDFIFDAEEGREIRRQVAVSVRKFLKEYIDAALAQKKSLARAVISKNPQFLYIDQEIDEFVESLNPSSNNEEKIHQEMALHRYRRQRRFKGINGEIKSAQVYDKALSKKVDEYQKFLQDDKKGALAEYVVRRKSVLELLDKISAFEVPEDEKHYVEEAVHELICPMKIDSHQISIDDHNLWILDDRLAFFSFFASDRPIRSISDVDSGREPDIALFYDSCLAWRETERSCDTVIVVEFKRPGKKNYDDKTDPFMQVMDYVSLFKSGRTIKDRRGKVITGIGQNTAFHCYIVADLTEGLKKRLRGRFDPTPDGRGLFGYTRNPDTYTEVIPYDKLLNDAQMRNSIFFDKLGIGY